MLMYLLDFISLYMIFLNSFQVISTSAMMMTMLRPFFSDLHLVDLHLGLVDLHLVKTNLSIGPLLKKTFLIDGRALQDTKTITGPLGNGGMGKTSIMTRQQNLTVQRRIWYHIDWPSG